MEGNSIEFSATIKDLVLTGENFLLAPHLSVGKRYDYILGYISTIDGKKNRNLFPFLLENKMQFVTLIETNNK